MDPKAKYKKLFEKSIDTQQGYETIIDESLSSNDIYNPCRAHQIYKRLANDLRTKSDSCSGWKYLVPYIATNYKK